MADVRWLNIRQACEALVAAHVHGDAIAREMFDAFEAQRTGEDTI